MISPPRPSELQVIICVEVVNWRAWKCNKASLWTNSVLVYSEIFITCKFWTVTNVFGVQETVKFSHCLEEKMTFFSHSSPLLIFWLACCFPQPRSARLSRPVSSSAPPPSFSKLGRFITFVNCEYKVIERQQRRQSSLIIFVHHHYHHEWHQHVTGS